MKLFFSGKGLAILPVAFLLTLCFIKNIAACEDISGCAWTECETGSDIMDFDTSQSEDMLKSMDIVALDGNTYHISDFSEDLIVVIFGRSGCGNTRTMTSTAADIRDSGVSLKLIIMDVDNTDSGLTNFAADKKALASINPPYNNGIFWDLLYAENLDSGGTVMLPGCFVMDQNRNLIFRSLAVDTDGLREAIQEQGYGGVDDEKTVYPFIMTYGQSEARQMLQRVNSLRTGSEAWAWDSDNTTRIQYDDLNSLTYDYGLEQDAMLRAAEIAISYSHTRPNGKRPFTAYTNKSHYAAENIASGYTSGDSVFDAWCETNDYYSGQGHRRNMLSPMVDYIGIGHVYYLGRHYWVQEFSDTPTSLYETDANDSSTQVSVEILESIIGNKSLSISSSAVKVGNGELRTLPEVVLSFTVRDHHLGGLVETGPVSASWTSADPSVAVVEGNYVSGTGGGRTILTASYGGLSASVSVTVRGYSDVIELNTTDLVMKKGSKEFLYVSYLSESAEGVKITWRSLNKNVAKVSKKGRVTAVGEGTTQIVAIPKGGGTKVRCTVTVVDR